MARAFCPKCGQFSFGYDPLIKVHRCYSVRCEFVDVKREFDQGLNGNPFSQRDISGLEITESHQNIVIQGSD